MTGRGVDVSDVVELECEPFEVGKAGLGRGECLTEALRGRGCQGKGRAFGLGVEGEKRSGAPCCFRERTGSGSATRPLLLTSVILCRVAATHGSHLLSSRLILLQDTCCPRFRALIVVVACLLTFVLDRHRLVVPAIFSSSSYSSSSSPFSLPPDVVCARIALPTTGGRRQCRRTTSATLRPSSSSAAGTLCTPSS